MEGPVARRDALWRVFLAKPCFLYGWEFDGGLWDALGHFELVWLRLKLDVKLVAKLMAGSAPRDADSWLGSSSSAHRYCGRAGSSSTSPNAAVLGADSL